MKRVWGGRTLETLYGKSLPPGEPIGESWEIVDREEAQSVVKEGPFAGKTLHQLWVDHHREIFGADPGPGVPARFPLLYKLLDAAQTLSVQVHPPEEIARELNEEPKSELWYVAECQPGSSLYAGIHRGVGRKEFVEALGDGSVADKICRLPVKPGDAIFIPSGRIHAIGAGNLIVEIQQNSDTTYRVFDWNRAGLDGNPRTLHIAESMRSIDFSDFEPSLLSPAGELLHEGEFFRVEKWELDSARDAKAPGCPFAIFICLSGTLECGGVEFKPGDFFLVPACIENATLRPLGATAAVLRSTLPL